MSLIVSITHSRIFIFFEISDNVGSAMSISNFEFPLGKGDVEQGTDGPPSGFSQNY